MEILGKTYAKIDMLTNITVADCFVHKTNKIGSGNGERKLMVGRNSSRLKKFFNEKDGEMKISCFFVPNDLDIYLDETKTEYFDPQQDYRDKGRFQKHWLDRKQAVDNCGDSLIQFTLHKVHLKKKGNPLYFNSKQYKECRYNLIREISLPNITKLSIIKLLDEDKKHYFYFKFFVNYSDPVVITRINKIKDKEEKKNKKTGRSGQKKYRNQVMELCPVCPVTLEGMDEALIASHIIDYSRCVDETRTEYKDETYNPLNGFMMTPNVDFCFGNGYITFENDGTIRFSHWMPPSTFKRLLPKIHDGMNFPHLPVEGREMHLEYHRTKIFKG